MLQSIGSQRVRTHALMYSFTNLEPVHCSMSSSNCCFLTCTGSEDPLEREMATLPSILAWRIRWTEEPGKLQSVVFVGGPTTLCCADI